MFFVGLKQFLWLTVQLLRNFLFRLRDRFSNSVMKRREYLDQQIQEMIGKPSKYNVLFFLLLIVVFFFRCYYFLNTFGLNRDLLLKSPYSVRTRENTDLKNSVFRHLSRSGGILIDYLLLVIKTKFGNKVFPVTKCVMLTHFSPMSHFYTP